MKFRNFGFLALTSIMLTAWISASVLAQRSRGVDGTGRGYTAGLSSGRQINHARQSSRALYSYTAPAAITAGVAANASVVHAEVIRPDVEVIGHNIAAAQAGIKVMKKEFPEEDIQKRISAIEKHLSEAATLQKAAHAECMRESPDGKMVMSCCNDLTKELEKARAEHAALMRHLEPAPLKPDEN
ncbi:MAG: hypothetical protein KF752_12225 [Pirellulaceae bacterium]|nr:hypothetical protein [Pirellulaceae bacterium]